MQITRLVILDGALGFVGRADWEEEHGLGVIMERFEVQEIGYQDLLL